MNNEYFSKQILTYMGNKRKLISQISNVIDLVERQFGEKISKIGEGFSGSGIVSRMLKTKCEYLYTNDIAGYSNTINKCYLTNNNSLSQTDKNEIIKLIGQCNGFMNGYNFITLEPGDNTKIPKFISKHWCPKNDDDIQPGERAYFTRKNAIKIDRARYFIENYTGKYKHFLLAPLLVEASIHNNTNGQFSAYFKDKNKTKGKFGGKGEVDIKRITKEISLTYPILLEDGAIAKTYQMDTNDWVDQLEKVDLIYYDPPYNKHPYNIYYFLLDIINNWDTSIEIPDTYRGQPKNWKKSPWCSFRNATVAFENLIEKTKKKTKFLMLSYNNTGIIDIETIDKILNKYGVVYKIPVEHKTYNKLKGIAAYKREKKYVDIKEFLWLVDFR
jgi:adenine-specific DNA-methyltransferase